MTKPARILAAATAITLLGIVPALAGPRIKPRIPLPAQGIAAAHAASVSSSSSSSSSSQSSPRAADFKQESSTSREFKDGLVSDINMPASDGSAKPDGSASSSASRHH